MDSNAFQKSSRLFSGISNLGKPPLEPFVIQLEEARDEWKRRGF